MSPDRIPVEPAGEGERGQLDDNIAAVGAFYQREDRSISPAQKLIEAVSEFLGQPRFLLAILAGVALWTGGNVALDLLWQLAPDPPPFLWLQGAVGLAALLTSTVVLAKQNRVARLAEQRAHLDLTVTLLTEQKAAKLIDLLEELRRDLPNVRDRHDAHALALQQAMRPEQVLAVLDEPRAAGAEPVEPAPRDPGAPDPP